MHVCVSIQLIRELEQILDLVFKRLLKREYTGRTNVSSSPNDDRAKEQ